MTSEILPLDPNRRRALVVVSPPVWRRLDDEPEARALRRSTEIAVVPDAHSSRSFGLAVPGGVLLPGRVYLQSPFRSDRYVEAGDAENTFAMERQRLYVGLCQLLGARKVEVLRVERVKSSHDQTVAVKGAYRGVGVTASAASGVEQDLQRQLMDQALFAGGLPNLGEAVRFLEANGLASDPDFGQLLELRESPNPLTSLERDYSVTTSSRSILKLAAGLKIPALFGVDVSYQSSLREQTSVRVRSRIVFGG
ncbi:MAG: hypothetical protein Q8S73_40110 [Deltaproteobacteria bacterium]|nr:hypothetical protein [Myxococcales bacterium]MDP3220371.1 hypothetical protein [Deltaproteobacteria bacterium]